MCPDLEGGRSGAIKPVSPFDFLTSDNGAESYRKSKQQVNAGRKMPAEKGVILVLFVALKHTLWATELRHSDDPGAVCLVCKKDTGTAGALGNRELPRGRDIIGYLDLPH